MSAARAKVIHVILLLALSCGAARAFCYFTQMLSFRTTESPKYQFNMSMHTNNTLSSHTTILEDIAYPMWNILLVQHIPVRRGSKSEPLKILYNGTYKVCEFYKHLKRVRLFHSVSDVLFNNPYSNMTPTCPMHAGHYVMSNIHIPPDNGMIRLIYAPNTIYTLVGTVYARQRNRTLAKMCSYEINATIVRKC